MNFPSKDKWVFCKDFSMSQPLCMYTVGHNWDTEVKPAAEVCCKYQVLPCLASVVWCGPDDKPEVPPVEGEGEAAVQQAGRVEGDGPGELGLQVHGGQPQPRGGHQPGVQHRGGAQQTISPDQPTSLLLVQPASD